ncbi:secreted RxLR effector peptide protein, putative [Phytophthora infestans T30-4]
MRLVYYVGLFVLIVAHVLTSCGAASTIADADQKNTASSSQADYNDTHKYLRSDAASTAAEVHMNSASDEERGIIPASVRIALKRLDAKDISIYR